MSGQGRWIRLFCCGETGWRPIGSAARPVVASRSSKPRCSDCLDVSRPHLSLLTKTTVSYRRPSAAKSIAQCHPPDQQAISETAKADIAAFHANWNAADARLGYSRAKAIEDELVDVEASLAEDLWKLNHDTSPALLRNCIALWRPKTTVAVWRTSHGRSCAPSLWTCFESTALRVTLN